MQARRRYTSRSKRKALLTLRHLIAKIGVGRFGPLKGLN
jgi:hypothetical protein